jgi:Skp family chaperone for outer membrane proteins
MIANLEGKLLLTVLVLCAVSLEAEESGPPTKPAEVVQVDLSQLPPDLAERIRATAPNLRGDAPAVRAAAPQAPRSPVALLDVGLLFQQHVRFQSAMDRMRTEVTEFETWMKQEQRKIEELELALTREDAAGPQFKALTEQIELLKGNLKARASLKRAEFLRREAEEYHRIYVQIETVAGAYAKERGITVVIRYSSAAIDPKDRDSVMKGINRPIVVADRDADITAPILEILNRKEVALREAR